MVQTTTSPVGYFADWDNKEVPIEARIEEDELRSVDVFMYNNILEDRLSASGTASAMIIKELPLTSINDIQSIVIYKRGYLREIRALGLVMELDNKQNDFDLLTPLKSTNMIEVAESTYRYDFLSIDTYTLGFSTEENTTQIRDSGASDTITEDAIINVVETNINMNGNVNITGNLVVEQPI